MNKESLIEWGFRLLAVGILIQALFHKLGAHPDSVLLFSTLGLEPGGRTSLGALELITAILLIGPETVKYGIVLGLSLMLAAIGTHLFILGIAFNEDGGRLFFLALVLTVSLLVLARRHQQDLLAMLPSKSS